MVANYRSSSTAKQAALELLFGPYPPAESGEVLIGIEPTDKWILILRSVS